MVLREDEVPGSWLGGARPALQNHPGVKDDLTTPGWFSGKTKSPEAGEVAPAPGAAVVLREDEGSGRRVGGSSPASSPRSRAIN